MTFSCDNEFSLTPFFPRTLMHASPISATDAPADQDGDTATATLEPQAPVVTEAPPQARPERRLEPSGNKPKRLPPYQVVLENDDDHTFEYVIELLQRIFGHPLEKAFILTEQIHFEGCAVVWTGSKEVAELKRDQIRGHGPDFYAKRVVRYPLGVRIEPMPGG